MFYFCMAAIICTVDILLKKYIQKKNRNAVFERRYGLITITFLKNKGAMLGFMKNSARLLLGITMTTLGFIAGILTALSASKKEKNTLFKTGLALIFGGALSNAIERCQNGEVTDYISFNFGPKFFRNIVFNIGDFCIFGGALITALTAPKSKAGEATHQ